MSPFQSWKPPSAEQPKRDYAQKCEVCRSETSSIIGIPACKDCRKKILNPCPHRAVLVRCRHPERIGGCNEGACPEGK